jgi:DNA-binding NtrC family response regulator
MVTGESGTARELVAQAIHQESPRRAGPSVSVNAEPFRDPDGVRALRHVKGAFTGRSPTRSACSPQRRKPVLDEVTEVPQSVQVKLLRAIQEGDSPRRRHARRQGRRAADRRVQSRRGQGGRRRDSSRGPFYRLNVIPINLPLLRERCEDIRPRALRPKISSELGKSVKAVSPEALRSSRAIVGPAISASSKRDRAGAGLERRHPRGRRARLTCISRVPRRSSR